MQLETDKFVRRERVDILLVKLGYFESRSLAQKAILSGKVRVGRDHLVHKCGEIWESTTKFNIAEFQTYVSRGAYKLKGILNDVANLPTNFVAVDVGASTGGFTQILLEAGASRIYAIDVGYGQLHYKLRKNPKVICLEKVNARYLESHHVPEMVDVATVDVSFISLTKILPRLNLFLKKNALVFFLIKPQFEAHPSEVGKGGIIKDNQIRLRVRQRIIEFVEKKINWRRIDIRRSPILGTKGNIEYICVYYVRNEINRGN